MKLREIVPLWADFTLKCQFGSRPAKFIAVVTEPESGLDLRIPVCEACSRLSEAKMLEMV